MNEVRFDLRLAANGSLTVHCTSRALPEEWADTVNAGILEQIELLRDRLARHLITEGELLRLGLLLGDALVPRSIQLPLARQIVGNSERPLRMRIVAHDPELAALPWEYVRLPSQHDDLGGTPLALNERVSLIRSPAQGAPIGAEVRRSSSELRVLHASVTEVEGFDPLRGDDHAVDLALWGESTRRSRRVVVDRLSDPVSRASLHEALAAGPDLMIFTGHSTFDDGRSALVLADENGSPELLDAAELAAMLLRNGTPLVVLNACDTAVAAGASLSFAETLVHRGVQTAVGMQMPISDSNAGHFAVGMIGALGEGHSIDVAVAQGRKRVADRAGYAEWGVPTLVTSSVGVEPLVDPTEVRTRSFAPSSAQVTRGGSAPAATTERAAGPAPYADEEQPLRRLRPVRGAVVVALAALMVAGAWFARPDGESTAGVAESATSTTEPTAGTTETTETTPTVALPSQDGLDSPRPLTGSSLRDTSPALRAMVEEFERTTGFATASPEFRIQEIDAIRAGWPGTPATAGYLSTNDRSNSDCRKVHLTSLTAVGVAGQIWLDGRRMVLVNAAQLTDQHSARQYFWSSTLFFGLRAGQCSGWPVDGIAVDPRSLEVSRMDFPIEARTDDVVTALGNNLDTSGVTVHSAYNAAFRHGDTVIVVSVASLEDSLDEEAAVATIEDAIRAFAPR